jgi:hypothetical protein
MKQLLPPANVTFNAAAKTITFATTIPSSASHILHVTNVTRGVIYFQPQAGSLFTGTYASPILTLACSTTGHNNADELTIIYDDGIESANASNQETANTNLSEISNKLITGGPQLGSGETTNTTQRIYNADAKIIDCSFSKTGSGLTADEAIQIGATGSGITVAQSYGNLSVDTGTTANSEFLMRSVDSIKGGHIARIRATLSQRIVNQHFGIYLADLIGSNVSFTTDVTGLLISVTLPSGHGFTSVNIGQSCYLGGGQGAAIIVPGRYAIVEVSGNVITFSPVFAATWTRATTTATVSFLGGNPLFSIGETATVSASSDVTAIVNGSVTLLTQATGGVTTFTCLNAGATTGTLTLTMSAKAWTPSASGTVTVFGWNAISAVKNGTSATLIWYDSQRKGWASGATIASVFTDASPGNVIQFSGDTTSSYLADSVAATAASLQFSSRASRMESLVDANTPLYLFIQVFNGVTAPASTTRFTVGKFSLEQTGINKVIVAGVSQTGSGNSQRVVVDSGTVTATVGAAGIAVAPVVPATPLIINSAASTNGQLVLTGTSGLQALYATNTGAVAAYVKLYNKATAPTVGTDVPAMMVVVPAAIAGVPGKEQLTPGFSGYRFPLGLGLAITGGAADADTTAVTAGQVKVILSRTV